MLISSETKMKNFQANNNSKENSGKQSCKMDYSPCFNDTQKITTEERSKKDYERTLRNSIYILVLFEQRFYLEDFQAIQKILNFENLPAKFTLENEKTSTQASVLKESLLFQNFCEGVFHKHLKQILLQILSEYKNLIKLPTSNPDFNLDEVSEEQKKANFEKLQLKERQEERIKDLFSELSDVLNVFEFKRDCNLEKNLNDAYVVLETLMYIFSSYFNFFRENFDFDFHAITPHNLDEAVAPHSTEKAAESKIKFIVKEPTNNSLNENHINNYSLEQPKEEINGAYFSKKNQTPNGLGIFDGSKNNENPERKKAEGFNEKKKPHSQTIPEEHQKSEAPTELFPKEEKALETKLRFITLIFNLFEEENFLNLFNCLLFTLDKLKNKTFHGFYSAINQKYLNTLFITGKKTISHFDNLIAFSVFTKRIISEEHFYYYTRLLKISESQINRFTIQSEYLDSIFFEYFLLNFKDENKTFTDKFSNLNGGLDIQLLFFSAFLEFWNKQKFYNVHNNIDFNTVFSNCTEALNQFIIMLKPKFLELFDELLSLFADPNKFLFRENNKFYKHLDRISLDNFKVFVDFLRQFICNHIFAAYVNDNNFEMINRTLWIKPVIEAFSLTNFSLKLLQIREILKSETKNSKVYCENKNNISSEFNFDNRTKGVFQIGEELAYKFFSFAFNEMFEKNFTLIPKRMLFLREVYLINFLLLFANFLEKTPFYLEYLRANPVREIVSALEKIAKFQNKYFFLLSNYLLKLIFPERKHKMRIYSFYNFPLDYLEIEESENLKSRLREIIFGQADTAQLLIEDRARCAHNKVKRASQDDDYTNPNKKNNSAAKNLSAQKFDSEYKGDSEGNQVKNCDLIGNCLIRNSNNFQISSSRLNHAYNSAFAADDNQNFNFSRMNEQEEFIEQDIDVNPQAKQINSRNCFYAGKPYNANITAVNNSANILSNDAIMINSIVNNLNKPSINNSDSINKYCKKPENLIDEGKNIKQKTKDPRPKSLSKAQIKKRISFQSEIFFDFSALFVSFQFDHLKLLEKINNKKLKFNYLTKNNKITNLSFNISQSFDNSLSSGEKVFLKVTNTKASFVLVQKEDEILFFDDSNFSELKSFFSLDMISKSDLEYFMLIGEENLKDNHHMLQNFVNNFENCDLKNSLSWDGVIENMYLFLD